MVEMTDAFRQPSLFYHLGVRESFSMANNIILYRDTNCDSLQSLQVQLQTNNMIPDCVGFGHWCWSGIIGIDCLIVSYV